MTPMRCRVRMACAALLLSCAASASAVEAACDGPDAVVLHPAAQATADARAYWLDAGSLRWPGKPVDGRYRLLASADAALRTSPGTVASGIDWFLNNTSLGKLLSDEVTGFYSRFDIGLIGALPGNPHGKGWIERWFRTVRDKHDKFFAGGQVYCGDDMAQETNRRLSADLNKKEPTRKLPSMREYVASFMRWLEHYHQQPRQALLIAAHRRQRRHVARRVRFSGKQPAYQGDQHSPFEPAEHRRMQQ